jgi:hypothetical protein
MRHSYTEQLVTVCVASPQKLLMYDLGVSRRCEFRAWLNPQIGGSMFLCNAGISTTKWLHGARTQKTTIKIHSAVRTSNPPSYKMQYDSCSSCRWGETVSELRPPTGLLFIPQTKIMESYGEMILAGENRRLRKETCPSDTFSTTNPKWLARARSRAPAVMSATNRLSHGTASI